MDMWGDHALVCLSGPDRNNRHNAIQKCIFEDMQWANMSPDKEKRGLLPARDPEADDSYCTDKTSKRRPADIFAPTGEGGQAAAFDIAVTCALRQELMPRQLEIADAPEAVVDRYAQAKRDYIAKSDSLSTEALCRKEKIRFIPLVVEAHGGGWSKELQRIIDWVASKQAAASGLDAATASTRIAQRISCALQRVNAEAINRRRLGRGNHGGTEEPDWIA